MWLSQLRTMIFGMRDYADTRYIKDILKGKSKKVEGYTTAKTNHEYAKKFWGIHFIVKYRVFIPCILLFDKLFGKYKETKIKDIKILDNIRIFETSVEKGLRIWWDKYINETKCLTKKKLEEEVTTNNSCKIVKSMKEWIITMLLYDNAYRELFNIIFFEMYKLSSDRYGKEKINHILHNQKNLTEVEYLSVIRQVQERFVVAKKEEPK